ncbi:MAG: DUF6843 domain-containing protein [Bryobacteraceae bacterium]
MLPRGIVIGAGLQIAAFVTGYLSVRYLYAMGWFGCLVISVPLFLASPFYILRAPAPLWMRLLLSFWLLAYPLYHAVFFAWEYLNMRPEIVLIPAGFQGKATVHFSDPAGAREETDGGKLVLRIGANGELRTQARQRRFSNYWVNVRSDERREYYYLEPSGRRVRLDALSVNDAPDRTGVIHGGGGMEGDRMVWLELYVGTPGAYLKSLSSP